MTHKIDQIEELLIKKLDPTKLIIDDKTHLHSKHAGHSASKYHLKIEIHSSLFKDSTKLEQHKLVMDILKPYLKESVHALSLTTVISED